MPVCWDGTGDYLTIQEGIDAAVDGDEVVVCDGTYTGDGNRDLDLHGKAITLRSASGDPETCIIDFATPRQDWADPVLSGRLLPPLDGDTGDPNGRGHAWMVSVLAAGHIPNADYHASYTPYSAMAPSALILPAAVETDPFSLDAWVDEFEGLYFEGADVLSCSVGALHYKLGAIDLESFVDQVVDLGGVSICIAVGDIHDQKGDVKYTSPASPSNAWNGIAVGALEDVTDNYDDATGETSYVLLEHESVNGPGRGRCKPDIVAPAEAVYLNPESGRWWAEDTETSGATPHVAGAVALLIQLARDEEAAGNDLIFVDDDIVDPRAIKAILFTSADKGVSGLVYDDDWNSIGTRSWQTSGSSQPLDYALGAGGLHVMEAARLLLQMDEQEVTRRIALTRIPQRQQDSKVTLVSVAVAGNVTRTLSVGGHREEAQQSNRTHRTQ